MTSFESRLKAALEGRFTLEHELGRGGMAIVFAARDVRHGRRVALKVLRPDFVGSVASDRLLHEIALTAALDHPHILPLYDSGEAGGIVYYTMPLVEAESLRARLDRDGRLPVSDAVRSVLEIADALHYAHERGIVHLDVKPENILLSGGHARVADFGIARAIVGSNAALQREGGVVLGTPEYMSPEQWLGESPLDRRSDVYALGCILYEMLAGSPPFPGRAAEVMNRLTVAEAPPLRIRRPDVPQPLSDAVMRALAKDPEARFPDAAAFASAVSQIERPRRRAVPRAALVTVIGLIAMAATSTAGYRLMRRTESDRPSIAVAPLRNLGEPGDAWFAEGLAQQLTAALTQVSGLAPRPYASVSASARDATDPLVLGRRLGVDYVLAATIHRQRDRLRITSELVRVRDGSSVWAPQSYDGTDADVFRMQDSITTRLVRELAGHLARPAGAKGQGSRDPEAYALYLRALDTSRISAPGSQRAIALLERAVAIDPLFADAWAELAGAYGAASQYSGEAPSELVRKISEATNRALALDSLNSRAWMELASHAHRQLDHAAAMRHWHRVLALAPSSAWAHIQYSKLLSVLADDDSARKETVRAIKLDPRESHFRMILGHQLLRSRDFGAADTALQHALRLNPRDWVVHVMLGRLALMRGQEDAAVRHTVSARALQGAEDPFSLAILAMTLGTLGRREEARSMLDTLLILARSRYVQHAWLAWGRYSAGDRSGALDELERSANAREGDFALAMDELYPALRTEVRYRELAERTGLARYWATRRDRWSTPHH